MGQIKTSSWYTNKTDNEPTIDSYRSQIYFTKPLDLFKGRNSVYLPMHNTDALRSSLHKVVQRMVASSIIQGGPGFPNFQIGLYKYFQNPKPNDLFDYIKIENVVDVDCLDALSKITFCFLTVSN